MEPEIYSLFREAATKSYMLGIDYAAEHFTHKVYITESDIGNQTDSRSNHS